MGGKGSTWCNKNHLTSGNSGFLIKLIYIYFLIYIYIPRIAISSFLLGLTGTSQHNSLWRQLHSSFRLLRHLGRGGSSATVPRSPRQHCTLFSLLLIFFYLFIYICLKRPWVKRRRTVAEEFQDCMWSEITRSLMGRFKELSTSHKQRIVVFFEQVPLFSFYFVLKAFECDLFLYFSFSITKDIRSRAH